MFDELYQQLLLEHAKAPHNRGSLEPGPDVRQLSLLNPLCGDEIGFAVRVVDNRVAEIRFDGKGCFISQAAASLLSEAVQGVTLEELHKKVADFRALMHGETVPDAERALGELLALEGVKRFPMRIKCALLAFEVLEKATRADRGT